LKEVKCINQETGATVPVVDQLIRYLVTVDSRLAQIDKACFLSTMIAMSTRKAKLI